FLHGRGVPLAFVAEDHRDPRLTPRDRALGYVREVLSDIKGHGLSLGVPIALAHDVLPLKMVVSLNRWMHWECSRPHLQTDEVLHSARTERSRQGSAVGAMGWMGAVEEGARP